MNFYELLLNRGQPSGEGMTHFERLFAAKLAGGGGEIKELEGVPPLLFKANGEPLIDWSIYGNTVQSTTPTTQNPVMPNGTGERTGNLLQIPDAAETTKNGVTYHVRGNSLFINGTSTTAFGFNIRNAFTLKAGTYTNQMYGFTGKRIYYSFNNVSTTMCTSDANLFKTFTISEDTTYANALVWINNGVTFNNEKIDFALFEGDTPKEFDVYGYKIPISSASTTTPVYLGEVEATRKIKKLVFDGSEALYLASTDSNRTVCSIPLTRCAGNFGLCSHIKWKQTYQSTEYDRLVWNNTDGGTLYISLSNVYLSSQTAIAFKSYLAQQYANGTPVTVWYVLATEETAVVNEPLMKIGEYADSLTATQAGVEIPTIRGNNTLDIDTTVKPSNVYIKYKD